MRKNFTYVDNSNVFIEGQRVSAVKKKLPGASTIVDAMNSRVIDCGWHIDYGSLHEFACGADLAEGVRKISALQANGEDSPRRIVAIVGATSPRMSTV